jgi:hypothetical protein
MLDYDRAPNLMRTFRHGGKMVPWIYRLGFVVLNQVYPSSKGLQRPEYMSICSGTLYLFFNIRHLCQQSRLSDFCARDGLMLFELQRDTIALELDSICFPDIQHFLFRIFERLVVTGGGPVSGLPWISRSHLRRGA